MEAFSPIVKSAPGTLSPTSACPLCFHQEGQLHERSFESELIQVHPFQRI